MGLTRTRRPRPPRPDGRGGELDALIARGHEALTARGAAPVAVQLDTALRLAGLHLRRAAAVADADADLRWAARIARFVAERVATMSPAAVVALGSRAVATLEACAPRLPIPEAIELRGAIAAARARVEEAERACAAALDDAVADHAIAHALAAGADAAADPATAAAVRDLAGRAVRAARAAGAADLADAAAALAAATGAGRGPGGAPG
ncbi:MAG: hypothetical protein KatS3mg009_2985 [Acidimicrobiia bacterium]|nr:MAG: hypothetical protein KatS3mg009_2985 [Acidimicrobiia bacterium]